MIHAIVKRKEALASLIVSTCKLKAWVTGNNANMSSSKKHKDCNKAHASANFTVVYLLYCLNSHDSFSSTANLTV